MGFTIGRQPKPVEKSMKSKVEYVSVGTETPVEEIEEVSTEEQEEVREKKQMKARRKKGMR